MSFFSRSKSREHYPHPDNGAGYYRRSHGTGIVGKILDLLRGSKEHSRSHSHHGGRHHPGGHHRRASWF
jgi:hypothetical protein